MTPLLFRLSVVFLCAPPSEAIHSRSCAEAEQSDHGRRRSPPP